MMRMYLDDILKLPNDKLDIKLLHLFVAANELWEEAFNVIRKEFLCNDSRYELDNILIDAETIIGIVSKSEMFVYVYYWYISAIDEEYSIENHANMISRLVYLYFLSEKVENEGIIVPHKNSCSAKSFVAIGAYCLSGIGDKEENENLLWDFTSLMQSTVIISSQIYIKMISRNIDEYAKKIIRKENKLNRIPEKVKYRDKVVEVKVHDDTYEKLMFEEIQQLQQRNAVLEEKLAVYDVTVPTSEKVMLEELYAEELKEVDLSKYKIIIAGGEGNKDSYPFDWIDIVAMPKSVARCEYADFVFMDTRTTTHSAYYKVKNVCRAANVPLFHITVRNKDRFLAEAKRLIGSYTGVI